MVITFYINFDWTNRIFPQISQFPHLIHSLIYLYDVKGNYFPSYTSNIYVSLEVLEAPGLQLFWVSWPWMAELSSLQIRYHHWIPIGFGIAETVQGLFKIVVKFELEEKSEDFRKPLETKQVRRLTNKNANKRRQDHISYLSFSLNSRVLRPGNFHPNQDHGTWYIFWKLWPTAIIGMTD